MRHPDEMERIALGGHAEYETLLLQLRKTAKYVQIVQIDGYNSRDPHIQTADRTLAKVDTGEIRSWLGTKRFGKAAICHLYRITDKSFFDYLLQFESFFRFDAGKNGAPAAELTDFGADDIAFLDEDKCPLFYTVTHEGLAFVHPDVQSIDVSYRTSYL